MFPFHIFGEWEKDDSDDEDENDDNDKDKIMHHIHTVHTHRYTYSENLLNKRNLQIK